jgi:DNA-binding CsgD family transcriptional regulator
MVPFRSPPHPHRRRREEAEGPAWAYLAGVPQDPEYPFHSLRWERWAGREELPLQEEWIPQTDVTDLIQVADRLAREAKLCERECAVLRRRVAGMSQRETAREMALRKATVGVIWKEVRAKVAAILEEAG